MGNHDVLRVAGPDGARLPVLERDAHAVHALHEGRAARKQTHHLRAHARHDPHVDGHVRAVRQLDPDF